MKSPLCFALVLVSATGLCCGQNFNPGTFFSPAIQAQHAQTNDVLLVDNSLVFAEQASGSVNWNLGVGGYAGATVTALLGVHLSAFTQTTGSSLVFGRNLEFEGLASLLQTQLASVVGANVLSTWTATAEVGGLNILAGQLYQVTFDVSTGPALDVSLLDSASFGIPSAGVTSYGGDSAGLVNLLDIVTVGSTPSNGQVSLLFSSSTNRSELDFEFDAASLVRLGLLGGTAGNQNIMTFSNIQVQAIPEPSAFGLSSLALIGLLSRRRR